MNTEINTAEDNEDAWPGYLLLLTHVSALMAGGIYLAAIFVIVPYLMTDPFRLLTTVVWLFLQPVWHLGWRYHVPLEGSTSYSWLAQSVLLLSSVWTTILTCKSAGYTGVLPIIGAVVLGVLAYIIALDPIFRLAFNMIGLGRLVTEHSSLQRVGLLGVLNQLVDWCLARLLGQGNKDAPDLAEPNVVHATPPPYSTQYLYSPLLHPKPST